MVDVLVTSPHVGIVPLTREQALEGLDSGGGAIRRAPRAGGTFPLVMLLGGPYYLATTAEVLASQGFIVCAPFRLTGQRNDVGMDEASWYLENSVRDGEWALEEMRSFPGVDAARVGVVGHGGGGLQALLFSMRNVGIGAVVNIDAGNFSTRTDATRLAFYSPRLQRSPYLYIATAETRKTQDKFAEFEAMSASDRYEVVLHDPAIRHHDLSDFGRAVTEPQRIRGEGQAAVQRAFVAVQESIAHFLASQLRRDPETGAAVADWLERRSASGGYRLRVHPRS